MIMKSLIDVNGDVVMFALVGLVGCACVSWLLLLYVCVLCELLGFLLYSLALVALFAQRGCGHNAAKDLLKNIYGATSGIRANWRFSEQSLVVFKFIKTAANSQVAPSLGPVTRLVAP